MTLATAIQHMKMHGFAGDHLLEHCEDDGCTVDGDGHASCGRVACPSCGFSGSNLTSPDGAEGDELIRCNCGFAWTPQVAPAGLAA